MPKRPASEPKKREPKKSKTGKYSDADPKPISDTNLNKRFTDELEVIKKAMEREGENVFKVRNTAKAISEIKTWGVQIVDEETAKMACRLPGVGKGTVESILEILNDGSSLRAAQAVVGQSPAEKAAEELSALEGVGSTIAARLAENNIRSFEDVRRAVATSSSVLQDCKTPDTAIVHAAWVEETMQPTSRAHAEAVRAAVHSVACKHGITSTELSGAYARGEDNLRSIRLLLVADGWTFAHRLDKLGAKCKSFAAKAAKGQDPEGGMPPLETIVNELREKFIAQATLRSAPHSCAVICVPTIHRLVEPAGVLADAGRVAKVKGDAKAEAAPGSAPVVIADQSGEKETMGAMTGEEHADAEPIDSSMALAASSSSTSSSLSSAAAKAASDGVGAASMKAAPAPIAARKSAASRLAAMMADVDDLEAEDEGAHVAQGWSEAAGAAASTSVVAASSSVTAAQAIGGKPVMLEAAEAAEAAERVRSEAEAMRGWLDRKALATIGKAKRQPPFGTVVTLQIVPGAFAASARVIQSFSSDALMALRAKAQRNGASISTLGVTMFSDEVKVVPSKEAGKPDKEVRLLEDLSREVDSEEAFWALTGVTPVAMAQRG